MSLSAHTRRPSVLSVGRYYPPSIGGMQTHLRQLARGMQGEVDARIVVANESRSTTREWDDGLPVTRLARWAIIASAAIGPGLVGEFRRSDDDIVHLHLPNPPATAAYLASGHRGRLVVTYHSDIVRQRVLNALLQPILDETLRRASAIIVSSREYLDSSTVLARYAEKCVVIPFGIPGDTAALAPHEAAERDRIREVYGNRVVVGAGRLVGYKGFEILIRAMAGVDAHLILVGGGPLHGRLEREIADCGLQQRVTMTGAVPSVKPYLASADVFVLSSTQRSEAFGIVQAEAMAFGVPVVNTALDTGVPFVSRHGETGLTVAPSDVHAISEAINTLLGDATLRGRLGEAARARVSANFDLPTMVRRTRDVYASVMAGAAANSA